MVTTKRVLIKQFPKGYEIDLQTVRSAEVFSGDVRCYIREEAITTEIQHVQLLQAVSKIVEGFLSKQP